MFKLEENICVLLLEQNEVFYKNLKGFLTHSKKKTYWVQACQNFNDFIEAVQNKKFDIALVDVDLLLPEDIQKIHYLASHHSFIPFILIFNHVQHFEEDLETELLIQHACEALFKQDINLPLLELSVDRCLEKHALKQFLIEREFEKELFFEVLHHRFRPSYFSESLVLNQVLQGHYGEVPTHLMFIIEELFRSSRTKHLLTDNLILLNKSSKKNIANFFQLLDLNKILTEIIETDYQFLMDQKSQTIQLNLDETLPYFLGNKHKIEQMIKNLIHNAFVYTPIGGKITVTSSLNKENYIQISIQDSGPGIPLEIEPVIFRQKKIDRPLYQNVGTGLGLYCAYEIALAHQGTLSYLSGEEEGSYFEVKLPANNHLS